MNTLVLVFVLACPVVACLLVALCLCRAAAQGDAALDARLVVLESAREENVIWLPEEWTVPVEQPCVGVVGENVVPIRSTWNGDAA